MFKDIFVLQCNLLEILPRKLMLPDCYQQALKSPCLYPLSCNLNHLLLIRNLRYAACFINFFLFCSLFLISSHPCVKINSTSYQMIWGCQLETDIAPLTAHYEDGQVWSTMNGSGPLLIQPSLWFLALPCMYLFSMLTYN